MQSFSSFWFAFTGIFGVFADIGLRQLTVREVARDKSLAGKYLGNIAIMKVIVTGMILRKRFSVSWTGMRKFK